MWLFVCLADCAVLCRVEVVVQCDAVVREFESCVRLFDTLTPLARYERRLAQYWNACARDGRWLVRWMDKV